MQRVWNDMGGREEDYGYKEDADEFLQKARDCFFPVFHQESDEIFAIVSLRQLRSLPAYNTDFADPLRFAQTTCGSFTKPENVICKNT
jgi:hypothetical protein